VLDHCCRTVKVPITCLIVSAAGSNQCLQAAASLFQRCVGCSFGGGTLRYPEDGAQVFVGLDELENSLREGQSRPGHFRGVATVVTKLFNLVQPHKAYFGQKDGAQCIVIKRIVKELLMNTEVNIVPTMREQDGLAMSSRNLYLSEENRPFATTLYKALKAVEKAFHGGQRDAGRLLSLGADIIQREEKVALLYLDLCCMESGKQYKDGETLAAGASVMLSGAVQLGKTRLIDNLIIQ